MKFASLNNGTRDGGLVLVSRDLRHALAVPQVAATMAGLLENWEQAVPRLQPLYEALNAGTAAGAVAFDPACALSPLPRTHQFVDASAFLNHGNIMEEAYKLTVKKTAGIPILIQRQSDDFWPPLADYPIVDEADNADFEGEFAVVVDDIAMGSSARQCESAIRLVMIMNDVSMRTHLFRELGMGFGFINAKPATVFGPVAVTLDEIGGAWQDGRLHLHLHVTRNGEWFGNPNGREMDWSFGELLAHLAYNRNLRAGTILGSGTVSNKNHCMVGSTCLAERRAIEMIEKGVSTTPFLHAGDRLRFEVLDKDCQSIFGAIEHQFVAFQKWGA